MKKIGAWIWNAEPVAIFGGAAALATALLAELGDGLPQWLQTGLSIVACIGGVVAARSAVYNRRTVQRVKAGVKGGLSR